jgi:hypothetical protein
MIDWLRGLLKRAGPRELRFVSYQEADRLMREDATWKLAPEEDHNREIGMVYIERPTR